MPVTSPYSLSGDNPKHFQWLLPKSPEATKLTPSREPLAKDLMGVAKSRLEPRKSPPDPLFLSIQCLF